MKTFVKVVHFINCEMSEVEVLVQNENKIRYCSIIRDYAAKTMAVKLNLVIQFQLN
jgi:hypothetical protein